MRALLRHCIEFCFKHGPYRGVILGNHTQGEQEVAEEVSALAPYVEFIHHDRISSRIRKKPARPFCLLTFDDGKKSCVDSAAPALERLGVPAVFYLVTAAVSSNRPLWFDRRNALVRHLGRTPAGLRREALKNMRLADINARLDQFFQDCPPDLMDMNDPHIASMSWDDARHLAKKGFTIGAHTIHHPILTNETDTRARAEVSGSIDRVTREIGSCPSFAFPNGNHTRELAEYAGTCGVDTAMTTVPVWVGRQSPLLCLPRIDIYNHYSRKKIWIKLVAALPGCLLKNPDGTGRTYVLEKWFGPE